MKVFLTPYFAFILSIYCLRINGVKQRAGNVNKTFSLANPETLNPTRILDSAKLHIPVDEAVVREDSRQLFQFKDKEKFKTKYVEWIYNAALQQFDVDGYNKIMDAVMSAQQQHRFVAALAKVRLRLPHCDRGGEQAPKVAEALPLFPGGPIRRNYGFDLTQWITEQLMAVAGSIGQSNPILGMLSMMAVVTLIGIIGAVLGTIIDIVPPMIPPPVWILRPFPCLPMLTGMNCLFSVFYPITIADFMVAHVTDQIMNGVLNSFPAKYNAKVGRTTSAAYNLCASVYLGMYCASIFPMCFLPLGLMEVQSFPICFPQCILVLIACPGFWFQDILGPCSSVSIPPFCSFSIFINRKLIPPQYTTYEESHPYPEECPKFDPDFDIPSDLYNRVEPAASPILEAAREKLLPHKFVPGKSLIKSIGDFNVVSPVHRVCQCPPERCDVATGGPPTSECQKICAEKKAIEPPSPTPLPAPVKPTVTVKVEKTVVPKDNRGHVIPAKETTSISSSNL